MVWVHCMKQQCQTCMISSDLVEVASCSRRGVLDSDDSVLLLLLYNRLKPGMSYTVINSVYVQHSAIMYRGYRYIVRVKANISVLPWLNGTLHFMGPNQHLFPIQCIQTQNFDLSKLSMHYIKVSFSQRQMGCEYTICY